MNLLGEPGHRGGRHARDQQPLQGTPGHQPSQPWCQRQQQPEQGGGQRGSDDDAAAPESFRKHGRGQDRDRQDAGGGADGQRGLSGGGMQARGQRRHQGLSAVERVERRQPSRQQSQRGSQIARLATTQTLGRRRTPDLGPARDLHRAWPVGDGVDLEC